MCLCVFFCFPAVDFKMVSQMRLNLERSHVNIITEDST
jgi:hypothetical protein